MRGNKVISSTILVIAIIVMIALTAISIYREEGISNFGMFHNTSLPLTKGDENELHIIDLPDDEPNQYQFHILHVIPKDTAENPLVSQFYIQEQIQQVNNWMLLQTQTSSFRFDANQGQLDITQITLPITEAEFLAYTKQKYGKNDFEFEGLIYLNSSLEDWLQIVDRRTPFLSRGKIYVAYFEISKSYVCGHAPLSGNRVIGVYPIALNLRDNSPCTAFLGGNLPSKDKIWVNLLTHEILHALGFPTACAKNIASDGFHVNDLLFPNDIMGINPGLYDPAPVLDPNHDDYFKTSLSLDCPDLTNSPFLTPLPENPQLPENILANQYWRLDNIDK